MGECDRGHATERKKGLAARENARATGKKRRTKKGKRASGCVHVQHVATEAPGQQGSRAAGQQTPTGGAPSVDLPCRVLQVRDDAGGAGGRGRLGRRPLNSGLGLGLPAWIHPLVSSTRRGLPFGPISLPTLASAFGVVGVECLAVLLYKQGGAPGRQLAAGQVHLRFSFLVCFALESLCSIQSLDRGPAVFRRIMALYLPFLLLSL